MANRASKTLLWILSAALLGIGGHIQAARADLLSTDQVVPAASERERLKALVARPEVARKLETLGVLQKDAQARVDALTDQEVLALAGRIDALPAGAMSDQNWLLVIIIILLVLIIA